MQEDRKGLANILIVDDEDVVLSLLSDALEEEAAELITTNSATKAIEIIQQNPIDLLITDIRMPGMDGIELAGRAAFVQPKIKIIFMTGYANLNTAKDAIRHGAIDYILKPFELKEIRKAVWKALNLISENKAKESE